MHGRFITIKISIFFISLSQQILEFKGRRAPRTIFFPIVTITSIYCLRFRKFHGMCLGILLRLVYYLPIPFRSSFGSLAFRLIMLTSSSHELWHHGVFESALDAAGVNLNYQAFSNYLPGESGLFLYCCMNCTGTYKKKLGWASDLVWSVRTGCTQSGGGGLGYRMVSSNHTTGSWEKFMATRAYLSGISGNEKGRGEVGGVCEEKEQL